MWSFQNVPVLKMQAILMAGPAPASSVGEDPQMNGLENEGGEAEGVKTDGVLQIVETGMATNSCG